MLPRLILPTTIKGPKLTKDLLWTIPAAYAPKLVDLLWHEAKVSAAISVVDQDESMVTATYSVTRANFVLFACLIFTEYYNECRIITNSYNLTSPLPFSPDEYYDDPRRISKSDTSYRSQL